MIGPRREAKGDKGVVRRRLRAALHGALALVRPSRGTAVVADEPVRVTFVLQNAFGMGGTICSVITQANHLARCGLRVDLVSVARSADRRTPFFELDPGVRLRLLDEPTATDLSPMARLARRLLRRRPSVLFHPDETRLERMSAWRDLLLVRELRRIPDGVVVGTRAGVNDAMARVCRPEVVLVGQEHVPLDSYTDALRRELAHSYRRLDAVMVLTEAEAERLRPVLAGAPTRIEVVPNALPEVAVGRADPAARNVVTAGRLSRHKRQDLLLRAFAEVAPRHPDWGLVVFGKGGRERRLRALADELGLADRVRFAGASRRLSSDLAVGSVFALTSEFEAFGIVLVEAMRAGLAVVATDCRHGPREIITPEVDGLLVEEGDVSAIADGLDRLMRDDGLRAGLGAAAVVTSRRYEPRVVAYRWRQVYREASAVRRRRLTGDATTAATPRGAEAGVADRRTGVAEPPDR